ncbi:MAG: glycosyltransferase, partial [Acidobacteria bacterium]|nr:glycosyltransferase [Acidobacteriota bacterium]
MALLVLHIPFLDLPYFWDEAGYYIPAALDFSRSWLLIPESTMPTGHTPLVMVYLGLLWWVF